jgi:peptidoglycan/xylan/chitin deacetylase (PgdA/CDA1 family)
MTVTRLTAGFGLSLAALLDRLSRWSSRRVGLALVYHRLGAPQRREGHLLPALDGELFEAQIRHLKRRYQVVPASELVGAVKARRRGQRLPVSITFDDDLPSHVGVAMPILRRSGVPATFFLSGRSLSAPFAFWWERLQIAFDRGLLGRDELRQWAGTIAPSPAPTDIHAVAGAIEAMPAEQRERVAQVLLDRLGSDPPDAGMRAADVRALADAGFEIGFHTLRHDALPRLGDEALSRAMVDGRDELQELLPRPIAMISYPHGKADQRVARAAGEAGYRFGFTTVPERLDDDVDPLLIGRIYPSHGALARFALDVSGTLIDPRR